MRTITAIGSVAFFLINAAFPAKALVISGPVTNPDNGHEYYLLAPVNWDAAEHEAENLGGTLAIIRNEAEQKWVFATFGRDGDRDRSLWIGLHRQYAGGPFVWVDGSKLDYVNWHSGQPDNAGGNENCAHMWAEGNMSGLWNDAAENSTLYAVAEVPADAADQPLNTRAKALIGQWYESGRLDRPAWIAGTGRKLFLITHDQHAARLVFTRKGFIYNTDRLQGEIVKDRILWSNGTWWSHQPAGYEDNAQSVSSKPPGLPSNSAAVIAGPIINPANQHEYFLLAPNTWSASESQAEQLGGTLAIIRNDAEQLWVFAQFGNYSGTNRSLWIGRWRNWPGAPFTSVTDEKAVFYNWDNGQPDNVGGREFFVQILATGKWNDNIDTANPVCGVVEVPGKSAPKTLAAMEKSLVGDWYNNGDPEQPCCVAATDNRLFAIDQNRDASRVLATTDGFLFSPKWKQHIVASSDRLLWSRGNWWSRAPVKFKMLASEPAGRPKAAAFKRTPDAE